MYLTYIVYLFSRLRVLYTPNIEALVVIVSYGPATLLRQRGLDTTDYSTPRKALTTWRTWPIWPQLYGVCYCFSNSYAIVFRQSRRFNYRPQSQYRQNRTHLLHIALYGDDIIG